MSTKLYVGNLSFNTTETDLRDLLGQHGPVNEINVVMDRDTGRARGFAFATMNTEEAAKAAIAALNGKDWKGRALTVNEARPREEGGGWPAGEVMAADEITLRVDLALKSRASGAKRFTLPCHR